MRKKTKNSDEKKIVKQLEMEEKIQQQEAINLNSVGWPRSSKAKGKREK